VHVEVPGFMVDVGTISQLARVSPHVNQRSGVSVRLSVANFEVLTAASARRALRAGERDAVPRVSDLDALAASTAGKIEVEALEEQVHAVGVGPGQDPPVDGVATVGEASLGRRRPHGSTSQVSGQVPGQPVDGVSLGHGRACWPNVRGV